MLDIKTVKLRSEEEIIASWDDKETIVVSVVCATFNHELYIEDAITGFLMQETDFAFEVIIHDDASTDKTASIVRRFQEKYPNIIKPIFQTENQYLKGNFKPGAYMVKFAEGEFLAWCEGDDYWLSPEKIQKQYYVLQENVDLNLCIHDAITLGVDGNKHQSYQFPKRDDKEQIIEYKEIYKQHAQFSPTASMFIRKNAITPFPDFFRNAPVGDFFLEALSGINGVYFIGEKLSVYRRELPNSWSDENVQNVEKMKNHNVRMLGALDALESHLPAQYRHFVKYKKQHIYLQLAHFASNEKTRENLYYYLIKSFQGQFLIKPQLLILLKLTGVLPFIIILKGYFFGGKV